MNQEKDNIYQMVNLRLNLKHEEDNLIWKELNRAVTEAKSIYGSRSGYIRFLLYYTAKNQNLIDNAEEQIEAMRVKFCEEISEKYDRFFRERLEEMKIETGKTVEEAVEKALTKALMTVLGTGLANGMNFRETAE